jgi:hypothetical protein
MGMSGEHGQDGAEPGKLSHWEVERYLRGELPPGDAEPILARLRTDPAFAHWMESMRQEVPQRDYGDLRRKMQAGAPNRGRTSAAGMAARLFTTVHARLPLPRAAVPAFGAIVLVVGAMLWMRTLLPTTGETYAAKGGTGVEIRLMAGEVELARDSLHTVAGGDTLAFWYRSAKPVHVQFWYREDGHAPEPFRGASASAAPWPAAQRWTGPAKRSVLEGNWSRQDLIVVASECSLTPETARARIQGAETPCPSETVLFHFLRRR